ncbi:MAG TPA: hypothetical protein VK147_11520 [Candidatus Didemnitutus sp.]|nr:hypothetical protein [Candidatus Didemnitutus sp.]
MEDYFKGITTKEGARRRFVALAKKVHPDVSTNAGNGEMIELSLQYRAILDRLNDRDLENAETHFKINLESRNLEVQPGRAASNRRSTFIEPPDSMDPQIASFVEDGLDLAERISRYMISNLFASLRRSINGSQ